MPNDYKDAIKNALAKKNSESVLNEGLFGRKIAAKDVIQTDKINKKVAELPSYEPVNGQMANGGAVSFRGLADSSAVGSSVEMAKRLTGAIGAKLGAATIRGAAGDAIKKFPIIISDDVGSDTAMYLKRLYEEQYAEILSLVVSNQVIDTGSYVSGVAGSKPIALQAIDRLHANTNMTKQGEINALTHKAASGELNPTDYIDLTSAFQLLREEYGVTESTPEEFVSNLMKNAVICENEEQAEYIGSVMESLSEELAEATASVQVPVSEAEEFTVAEVSSEKVYETARNALDKMNVTGYTSLKPNINETFGFLSVLSFMDTVLTSRDGVASSLGLRDVNAGINDQMTTAGIMSVIYNRFGVYSGKKLESGEKADPMGKKLFPGMPIYGKIFDTLVYVLYKSADLSCAIDVVDHRYSRYESKINAAMNDYNSPKAKSYMNTFVAERRRAIEALNAIIAQGRRIVDTLRADMEQLLTKYIQEVKGVLDRIDSVKRDPKNVQEEQTIRAAMDKAGISGIDDIAVICKKFEELVASYTKSRDNDVDKLKSGALTSDQIEKFEQNVGKCEAFIAEYTAATKMLEDMKNTAGGGFYSQAHKNMPSTVHLNDIPSIKHADWSKLVDNARANVTNIYERSLSAQTATSPTSTGIGFVSWAYAAVLKMTEIANGYLDTAEEANFDMFIRGQKTGMMQAEKNFESAAREMDRNMQAQEDAYSRDKAKQDNALMLNIFDKRNTAFRDVQKMWDNYTRNSMEQDENTRLKLDVNRAQADRDFYEKSRQSNIEYRYDRIRRDRAEAVNDIDTQRAQEKVQAAHEFDMTKTSMDREFSLQKKEESFARQRDTMSLASLVNIGTGSDTEMDEMRLEQALARGTKRAQYDKLNNLLIAGVINVKDYEYACRKILYLPISDKQMQKIVDAYDPMRVGGNIDLTAGRRGSMFRPKKTGAEPSKDNKTIRAEIANVKNALNRVELVALGRIKSDLIKNGVGLSAREDKENYKRGISILSKSEIDSIYNQLIRKSSDRRAMKDAKKNRLSFGDAVASLDDSFVKSLIRSNPALGRLFKSYTVEIRGIYNDEMQKLTDTSSFVNAGDTEVIPEGSKSKSELEAMLRESLLESGVIETERSIAGVVGDKINPIAGDSPDDYQYLMTAHKALLDKFDEITTKEINETLLDIENDTLDYILMSEALYGDRCEYSTDEVQSILEGTLLKNDVLDKAKKDYTTLRLKYYPKNADDTLIGVPDSFVRAPLAYGSVERDLKTERDRKFYQPLTLKIKFKERYGDEKFSDNELVAVVGILGSVIRVPTDEMAYILKSNLEQSFAKNLASDITKYGVARGITANFMSTLLGTKEIQSTIKNLPKSGELWDRLSSLSQQAVAGALAGKDAKLLVNAHLVFSIKEVDQVSNETGTDYLRDKRAATSLIKRYSAFALAIVNPVTDSVMFYDDTDNTGWYPVSMSFIKNAKTEDTGLLADMLKYYSK